MTAAVDAPVAGVVIETVPGLAADGAPLRISLVRGGGRDAAGAALTGARPLLEILGGRHLATPVEWFEGVDVGWAHEARPTVQDRLDEGGPMPLADAARTASQVALALATVHAAGLVHGDVSTSTVGLGANGALLLDLPAGVLRGAGLLPGPPPGTGTGADLTALAGLLRAMLGGAVPAGVAVVVADLEGGSTGLRQVSTRLLQEARVASRAPSVVAPRASLPRSAMPPLGTLFPPQPVVDLERAEPVDDEQDLPALVDVDGDLDTEAAARAAALDLDAIAYSASIHPEWAASHSGSVQDPGAAEVLAGSDRESGVSRAGSDRESGCSRTDDLQDGPEPSHTPSPEPTQTPRPGHAPATSRAVAHAGLGGGGPAGATGARAPAGATGARAPAPIGDLPLFGRQASDPQAEVAPGSLLVVVGAALGVLVVIAAVLLVIQ